MRILVVNQYFHPDQASTSQLLTELCEDLSRDHDVTVVAGRPSYSATDTTPRRALVHMERHGSVRVLRTWSTSFPRSNMAGRLANYLTYLMSCLVGAFRAVRPDVVLTMTDPPIVAAAAATVSRSRRVPFVYVNQDIFPEVAVVLGRLGNPTVVRGLSTLNRALRRSASRVVAIGDDMRDRLIDLGTPQEKIAVIPNWADGQLIRPLDEPSQLRARWGWGDRFVVMHSGNVGLSQDLETLIDATGLLREHGDILVAIVGDGAMRGPLEERARRRAVRNVVFLPYQPKSSLAQSLGAADLHLVSLRRGLAGYIVPSKVYGIIAAGKPFLAAVEEGSEIADLIQEHGCGIRTAPGDPTALASAIVAARDAPLTAMGARGRAAFEQRYDRPIATAAYRSLLEEVAARR
jgi:colanic acid biosynthesis glycosyl transferase WcaI